MRVAHWALIVWQILAWLCLDLYSEIKSFCFSFDAWGWLLKKHVSFYELILY